ncbi:unnamed protein product [Durusdinium trenchii]
MLLMAPYLLNRHPDVGRRQIFHAAAGASALAGLGQVLFLVLNQPAVVHFYILPNIMVMDLFNGMQSPFVAMHMLVHTCELPCMFYMLGRLAGRRMREHVDGYLSIGVYGVFAALSAATPVAFVRWPLFVASTMCIRQIYVSFQDLENGVETLYPAYPMSKFWSQRHKRCLDLLFCCVFLHPIVQSVGYSGYFSQASQMCTYALMDLFMSSLLALVIVRDETHVSKAEVFMAAKERQGALQDEEEDGD